MPNRQHLLSTWGWNSSWEEPFSVARGACPEIPDLTPGRVTGREGPIHLVETILGPRRATISGRLQFRSPEDEWPLVGDWVVVQVGDDHAVIHGVVGRRTVLARAVSEGLKGAPERRSVLAANLDVLAIVTGLDGNFNPRRAQRLATLARHGAITPLWVLTKIDLADAGPKLEVAREAAGADPVLALSSVTGEGLEALASWLRPGTTVGLAGSSGVGKTTLVNRLLGTTLATTEVRGTDSKGRHTTTARHLYGLPSGALLMDAPGFRTVGLWADEVDLAGGFEDIEELARGCRFGDCRHDTEPGCAVRRALDAGTLSPVRWDGWLRQARDLAHLSRRDDPVAQRTEKDRWKSIHQSMRGFTKQARSGG